VEANVRQLYNVLLQAANLALGEEIRRADFETADANIGGAPEPTGGLSFGGNNL